MSDAADNQPIRDRFRVRFAKTGLLRWIGHRDLQRLWERLLRRADLRLSMSAGFNPKPRISFPSALALGVEGLDEVVEIELTEPITAEQLQQRLAADGQPGLSIRSVQLVARFHADGTAIASFPGLGKAQVHSSEYEITLPPMIDRQRIDTAIAEAKQVGRISIGRKGKDVTADIATTFPRFERRDQILHLTQINTPSASLKPTDVLTAIGLGDLIEHGAIIRRTKVVLADEMERPHAAASPTLPAAHPSETDAGTTSHSSHTHHTTLSREQH